MEWEGGKEPYTYSGEMEFQRRSTMRRCSAAAALKRGFVPETAKTPHQKQGEPLRADAVQEIQSVGSEERIIDSADTAVMSAQNLTQADIDEEALAYHESHIMISCFGSPKSTSYKDWMDHFNKLERFLQQIFKQMRSYEDFQQDAEDIVKICHDMMKSAEQVFSLAPRKYINHGLDQKVWKTALYTVIQVTSRATRKNMLTLYPQAMECILMTTIKMGRQHYANLISAAKEAFDLNLEPIFERKYEWDPSTRTAPDLLYQFFIYMGDLSRYAMHTRWSDRQMDAACQYYELARLLDVKKGRSFYQVAVLQLGVSNLLGSLYFFMRAHSAETPVGGVHMKILEVFHYAFQKHEKEKDQYWYALSRKPEQKVRWQRDYCREIWVMNNSEETQLVFEKDPPTKEQHIQQLTYDEVYERFVLAYTLCLGKTFTNVGTETFEENAEECLVYFEGLLNSKGNITFERFMQIVGLSMYVIDSLKLPVTTCPSDRSGSAFMKRASTDLLLELFTIVVEKLSNLAWMSDWNSHYMICCSAAVKLWCDWLTKNRKLWTRPRHRPIFAVRRLEQRRTKNQEDLSDDVWTSFAQLMNRLNNLFRNDGNCVFPRVTKEDNGCTMVPLKPFAEYLLLVGWGSIPSSETYQTHYFHDGHYPCTLAQVCVRLESIFKFGSKVAIQKANFVRKLETPTGYSTRYVMYESQATVLYEANIDCVVGLKEDQSLFWACEAYKKDKKDLIVGSPDCNRARVILRKKPTVNPLATIPYIPPRSRMNEIWCQVGDQGFRSDIVVKPMRIVLDTNCFINKFEYVKKLPQYFPQPILLPVSVVLELKGLAKGGLRTRHREKFADLTSDEAKDHLDKSNSTAIQCKAVLDYLDSNLPYYRVVTTFGRILIVKSIYDKVQDEFYDATERNDDRILNTCRNIERLDLKLRAKDEPHRIYRNTVLLTGDRCLRIRTLVLDIPARDISSVVYWASTYNNNPDPAIESSSSHQLPEPTQPTSSRTEERRRTTRTHPTTRTHTRRNQNRNKSAV